MKDYDRTTRNEPESEQPKQNKDLPRLICGVLLLVFGCFVAGWAVTELLSMVTSGAAPGLVKSILPGPEEPTVIRINEEAIELPPAILKFAGYGVVFLLMLIVASLAGMLIKNGVALLSSDTRKLIEDLTKQLKRR